MHSVSRLIQLLLRLRLGKRRNSAWRLEQVARVPILKSNRFFIFKVEFVNGRRTEGVGCTTERPVREVESVCGCDSVSGKLQEDIRRGELTCTTWSCFVLTSPFRVTLRVLWKGEFLLLRRRSSNILYLLGLSGLYYVILYYVSNNVGLLGAPLSCACCAANRVVGTRCFRLASRVQVAYLFSCLHHLAMKLSSIFLATAILANSALAAPPSDAELQAVFSGVDLDFEHVAHDFSDLVASGRKNVLDKAKKIAYDTEQKVKQVLKDGSLREFVEHEGTSCECGNKSF
jgi:hypothetical protein